jgi:RNA:NAD 2'-phosphotransferase (TPT1/KptA family)
MQDNLRFAYHGTSAENVESILENGLLPREATGYDEETKTATVEAEHEVEHITIHE